jgi:hypothetical protein
MGCLIRRFSRFHQLFSLLLSSWTPSDGLGASPLSDVTFARRSLGPWLFFSFSQQCPATVSYRAFLAGTVLFSVSLAVLFLTAYLWFPSSLTASPPGGGTCVSCQHRKRRRPHKIQGSPTKCQWLLYSLRANLFLSVNTGEHCDLHFS